MKLRCVGTILLSKEGVWQLVCVLEAQVFWCTVPSLVGKEQCVTLLLPTYDVDCLYPKELVSKVCDWSPHCRCRRWLGFVEASMLGNSELVADYQTTSSGKGVCAQCHVCVVGIWPWKPSSGVDWVVVGL
jgi:hypothetical protein